MYLAKTPALIQRILPNYTWRIRTSKPVLYLTFDDGPIPEVTPWVIGELRRYGAKATFFCVGENVMRHPDIYQSIQAEGHRTGNHTYNHLNGRRTETIPYLHNIRRCARYVKSDLFRPPYGMLTRRQRLFLQKHYRIVMWDVLSGDFDPSINEERCLGNVLHNASAGSIIVMHDSVKTERKLRYILPRTLEYFSEKGFAFEAIPD